MINAHTIDVVIFDCDGVLFDSWQANVNFYNHLLERFRLPAMSAEQEALVHMLTSEESVREIFRGTSFENEAQAYQFEVDYTPFINDMVMESGLVELLERLTPTLGLAIATNRSHTIKAVLESFSLTSYFDIVISTLDVKRPKPHPEPILKILDFFQISQDQAIYVGDSLIDQQTARNAGVAFIAYKNRALTADHYADQLTDIARLLGR
jgi:HAD superfamily hydrolase (TIGR01509 family)